MTDAKRLHILLSPDDLAALEAIAAKLSPANPLARAEVVRRLLKMPASLEAAAPPTDLASLTERVAKLEHALTDGLDQLRQDVVDIVDRAVFKIQHEPRAPDDAPEYRAPHPAHRSRPRLGTAADRMLRALREVLPADGRAVCLAEFNGIDMPPAVQQIELERLVAGGFIMRDEDPDGTPRYAIPR